MKIIEYLGQNYLAYSFKTFKQQEKNILSGGLAVMFSLVNSKDRMERLFDANELNLIIQQTIRNENFWDLGFPKGSSEVVVYGSAYSVKPVGNLVVSFKVGQICKTVMVFGDRIWTDSGIGEVQPFKIMPLTYNKAFGGEHYQFNPLGKGYLAKKGMQLANIENLNHLILARNDISEPACFEPYPLNWPQRSQYFDENLPFTSNTEIIPPTCLPQHFNTAPLDQRLNSFFIGDEEIEIRNMNQLVPTIFSSLPGLRLRVFILQKNAQDTNSFVEISSKPETLVLLPNLGYGVLLFRASCLVANLEATDISCVYTALEELTTDPKSIEYYYQYFIPLTKLDETDYLDTQLSIKPSEIDPQSNINIPNLEENSLVEEPLEKLQFLISDESNLNESVKATFKQLDKVLKQLDISISDSQAFIAARKEEGLPPILSNEELYEMLTEVCSDDPELMKKLKQSINDMSKIGSATNI